MFQDAMKQNLIRPGIFITFFPDPDSPGKYANSYKASLFRSNRGIKWIIHGITNEYPTHIHFKY